MDPEELGKIKPQLFFSLRNSCISVYNIKSPLIMQVVEESAIAVTVRHMTNQLPLSSIVKSRHLSFFGHLVRMDENADASEVIFEPLPESWRRQVLSLNLKTAWEAIAVIIKAQD